MAAPSVESDARPVPSAVLNAKIDYLAAMLQSVQNSLVGFVTKDFYAEARQADQRRIAALEQERTDQRGRSWQLVAMLVAAGLAVLSSVTSSIIVAVMLAKNGG